MAVYSGTADVDVLSNYTGSDDKFVGHGDNDNIVGGGGNDLYPLNSKMQVSKSENYP